MKRHLLSFACVLALSQASAVNSAFSYQDYLDFGANLGRFSSGATGLVIKAKDGSSVELNAPMPDFSAANGHLDPHSLIKGETTNIGGNYLITAAHMISPNEKQHGKIITQGAELEFGGERTKLVSSSRGFGDYFKDGDSIHAFDSDFAVLRSHKLHLAPAADLMDEQVYFNHSKDGDNLFSDEKGVDELLKSNKYTLFARSGTGVQLIAFDKNGTKIAPVRNYFTGGLTHNPRKNPKERGIYFDDFKEARQAFSSVLAQGDSGSALYGYNSEKGRWEVIAVASQTSCKEPFDACTWSNYQFIDNKEIKDFKDEHTLEVSKDLTSDGEYLKNSDAQVLGSLHTANIAASPEAMQNDKDLYITAGNQFELGADSNLGSSALYIKTPKYLIKGAHKFIHGGLDIAPNSSVRYEAITPEGDNLHKIGEGELIIAQNTKSPGGLRLGGGRTVLEPGASFKDIYLTNNATLVANDFADKNNDIGSVKINNGTLDLNGNKLWAGELSANEGARIVANKESSLSLYSAGVVHANISGDIHLEHKLSAKTALYDNGFDVKDLNINSNNTDKMPTLVLQGRPFVHNHVDIKVADKLADDEVFTNATEADGEFKTRDYKAGSAALNGVNLKIARDAHVTFSQLDATNAHIDIGESTVYVDKLDGQNPLNTTPNTDRIEQSDVPNSNITFTALTLNLINTPLTANDSHIIAQLKADEGSKIRLNNVQFQGSIDASELDAIHTNFMVEKPNAINVRKQASGYDNHITIMQDFSSSEDKILIASLASSSALPKEYFEFRGFSNEPFIEYEPNMEFEQGDGVYKWYLRRISKDEGNNTGGDDTNNDEKPTPVPEPEPTPAPTPTPVPEPTPDATEASGGSEAVGDEKPEPSKPQEPTPSKPQNPTEASGENKPEPSKPQMDFDLINNPGNVETPEFYKDYFFVRENTHNIAQATSALNQIFFAHVLEWNNLYKRMGELRSNNGTAGIWAKGIAGASRYESSAKTNFYELQAGVDAHTEFDGGRNFSGVMMSAVKMRPRSDNITNGDINGMGFGLYTSWIFDNGYYLDAIVKYSRLKNHFDIVFTNANGTNTTIVANNPSTNVIASAEFGRRFMLNSSAYIEPSIEIISGHVGEQTFSSDSAHVQLKSQGFAPFSVKSALAVGQQASEQNPFGWRLQAAGAFDLAHNGVKTIRDLNVMRHIQGERDSRLIISGAASYQAGNNATLNLEFERSFLGKMNTPYVVNFTVRKEF